MVFPKKLISFVLDKIGLQTYYSYQKYCKMNKGILYKSKKNSICFLYQTRKKRFVFLYYFSCVLLFVIIFLLGLMFSLYVIDFVRLIPKLTDPWRIVVIVLIEFLVVALVFFLVVLGFLFYKKRIMKRKKISVKKYMKGDQHYD